MAGSYAMVLVGAFIAGVSQGGLGIAHNVLVSESVPQRIRRQALSGLHCCYGVASLVVPLYVTFGYGQGFRWQTVMLGLVIGPALVVLIAEFERAKSRASQAEPRQMTAKVRSGPRPWRTVAFFGTLMTLYVIGEIAIGTRLVLFARRDGGYSVESANLLLTGYFLLLFVGRLAFALLRIPMSNLWILILSASLGAVSFALGLIFEPWWLSVTGLAISMFYPVGIAMIGDETGEDAGFVTSWCITMQFTGLMTMHFLLGAFADIWGLGRALWIGPICLALAFVMLVAKWRHSRFSLGKSKGSTAESAVGKIGL
jgi:fucose permease